MNERAVAAYREFLTALGVDLGRAEMEQTPARVTALYETLLAGMNRSTSEVWGDIFESEYHGLVTVSGIHFHSLCEHHMLPFFGTADITYEPCEGRVAGLSKLESLVRLLSRRPQLQERLTEQIAAALRDDLGAKSARVRLRARHLCMTMKGESSPGTEVVTVRGFGRFAPENLPSDPAAWRGGQHETSSEL